MKNKLFFVLIPLLLVSCTRPSEIDLSTGWKMLNIDISGIRFPDQAIPQDTYSGMVDSGTDTSTWKDVKLLPAALTMERKKQLCLLRKDVVIPDSMKGRDLSLYLGKVWDAEVTYFNGVRIGSSGNDYPDFHSDWNVSVSHFIPQELVKYGEANTIVIRQFSDQQLNFNGSPFIGEEYPVRCYTFMERFMAEYLVMGLGVMTLTMGMMLIALYIISKGRNRAALYFGTVSILWFVLTMHFWLPCYWFMSWRVQDNIFYVLVAVIYVLIFLSLELILNLRLKRARVIIFIIFLLQVGLSVTATVDSPMTGWRFDVIGPVGVLGQIMWGYVIFRGIREGNVEARILLIGYAVFVVTLIHDALMMNRIIMSYAFLTNIAYPGFILSFAVILLRRMAILNKNLVLSKTEIESKNASLEDVMKHITEASDEIRELADSLNNTSSMLNLQMDNQAASLGQTSASTEEVSSSITSIAQNASDQNELVQRNSTALESYLSSIHQITSAAKVASSLGGRSREETGSINEKLLLVREGMGRIRESSAAIEQIADIINDIAEKTNLLSLNAAIEAARAGQFGRGFAVVADEIGKLADGSVEQAKTIQRIIHDVVSNIETENRLIMESADSITALKTAADDVNNSVAEIMNLCNRQETLTVSIQDGMKNIAAGSSEISIATREQQAAMDEVISTVVTLAGVVEQVNFNTLKIFGISQKLSDRVDILNRLAAVK